MMFRVVPFNHHFDFLFGSAISMTKNADDTKNLKWWW